MICRLTSLTWRTRFGTGSDQDPTLFSGVQVANNKFSFLLQYFLPKPFLKEKKTLKIKIFEVQICV